MPAPSLDEIIARRRLSVSDTGTFYKAVALADEAETRGYDPEKRAQRFVMSSESVDLYGDIVRQDGMDTENFMRNPVGLAYHDHRAPIGWWSDLKKVGGSKKRTEGTLTLHASGTTQGIDEVSSLLAAGAIRACSIGFMPTEYDWILDENGRNTYGFEFRKSTLLECSVCTVPANPDALAKAAGGDPKLAAEFFELALDTYCERTTGGLFVRKEFEDAYMAMKARKTVHVAPSEPVSEDVTGVLTKLRDGVAALFASLLPPAPIAILEYENEHPGPNGDPWAGYDKAITVTEKMADDGARIHRIVGEFPAKMKVSDEVLQSRTSASPFSFEDGVLTLCFANARATYKVAGNDEATGLHFFDLIEANEIPESEAPALVPGSRAKALAKTASLRAAAILASSRV